MADGLEYIPIEKDLIPYRFDIVLNNRTFTFAINYNAEHDFFTIDLYRNNNLIIAGEKIVYGKLLFECQQYFDVPDILIIPYDLAQNETRVTWANLNNTVFLWLVNDDG